MSVLVVNHGAASKQTLDFEFLFLLETEPTLFPFGTRFGKNSKNKREKNRNPTSWSDGEFGAVSIRRKFSFLGGDKKGQQR